MKKACRFVNVYKIYGDAKFDIVYTTFKGRKPNKNVYSCAKEMMRSNLFIAYI